jgi:hypothetical protein
MRQTLHLVPTSEFWIYSAALCRTLMNMAMRWMTKLDVTSKEADGLTTLIVDALTDGPLSKQELRRRVEPNISKTVRRWMDHVWLFARLPIAQGLICYGPSSGQDAVFIRSDQWIGARPNLEEREAQRILLQKFLRAYGPAKVRDFSKWSGLAAADARAAADSLRDGLVEVKVDGNTALLLAEDRKQLSAASLSKQVVRLLPGFDPYLLAHADKNHLVAPSTYKRVYRNQGWISPVVLCDGRVIATWALTRDKDGRTIEIEPFAKLPKSVRQAIEGEAASLGRFVGAPCMVNFVKAR